MYSGNYWERLALIIDSLVDQKQVESEDAFYALLELDPTTVTAVRNQECELPHPAEHLLKDRFNIGIEFLKVGLGPMIRAHRSNDLLLEEEDLELEADDHVPFEVGDLKTVLTDAIRLSKQDLKNKGHISEEDE